MTGIAFVSVTSGASPAEAARRIAALPGISMPHYKLIVMQDHHHQELLTPQTTWEVSATPCMQMWSLQR